MPGRSEGWDEDAEGGSGMGAGDDPGSFSRPLLETLGGCQVLPWTSPPPESKSSATVIPIQSVDGDAR